MTHHSKADFATTLSQSQKSSRKFFALTAEEWTETTNKLTKIEIQILYFLRAADPYSNGISAKSRDLAARFNTTQRSVNRAIAHLKKKNLVEAEPTEWELKLKVRCPDLDTNVQTQTPMSKPRHQCPDLDINVQTETLMSSTETLMSSFDSEVLTESEFQDPKNIKTIKNIHTLLEQAQNQEKKTKNLSPKAEETPLRTNQTQNSSSSTKQQNWTTPPAPALENSAKHWALTYDEHASDRLWLLPPRRRDDFNFHPEFLDFHAKLWCEKYKKPDFHSARADFRNHLINQPEKIPLYWEDFEADQKRREDNGELLRFNNFENFKNITKRMPPALKQDFDADNVKERCLALMANSFTAREGIELAKAKGWTIEYSESGYPLGISMPEEE